MDTFCSASLRKCQKERARDKKKGWSQEQKNEAAERVDRP